MTAEPPPELATAPTPLGPLPASRAARWLAADQVAAMCDGFLTNPVIESYRRRVIGADEPADAGG